MATLTITSGAQSGRTIVLEPGTHGVGRAGDNQISLLEPSISSHHCELTVSEFGIGVLDLGSTNGTFINGERITKKTAQNGDTLRLGDIEFDVELPEVHIAIPETALVTEPPGAAFLEDGNLACFNHRDIAAVYRCTRCENWWCSDCVRHLKRVTGDFLHFCPDCSGACSALQADNRRRKNSFFERIAAVIRRGK